MLLTETDQDKTAEDLFLTELKIQFDREIDLKKNLDAKSIQMVTIASSLVTISLAIATFLISKIADKDLFYYASIFIFGIAICLAIKAIWKSIKSYGLRDYDYPIGHSKFFEKGIYDLSMVDGVRHLTESQFKDRMFEGYIISLQTFDKRNGEKSVEIKDAQTSITYTLVTIAFLVFFALVVKL